MTGIVVLELVRDLLGVVERLGDDEMHAHVSAAVGRGRGAPGGPTERRTVVRRSDGSSSAKMSSISSRRRREDRRRTFGRSR